ncbi:MAG: hypothetical protein ACTJIB_07905 [Pseudoalteromonas prydzensis]|uniref:Outer membrane protein beta-barrel domain-containing protein n=1 Tax=Pseudoalteromonas prydzensis TaxID=182141 RepID=A0ABR9FN19_9GAMM|nr:hypothetical protein [Pseudoalteromonas prydzensis]MBE0458214.1 hypothetical protein [Pseudoalteromonas prydzensis]
MGKILAILLLSISFQCFADSPYIGIDYMLTNIEISNQEAKPNAAILRAGISNNNMAFEAQYLASSDSDDIYNLEFDIDKSLALFFVMQSEEVNGFGLDLSLGYAMTDMIVKAPTGTLSTDYEYNGFAWGVAIHQQIPYLENTNVRLAYQSLFKGDDVEIKGLTLGFTYQF